MPKFNFITTLISKCVKNLKILYLTQI